MLASFSFSQLFASSTQVFVSLGTRQARVCPGTSARSAARRAGTEMLTNWNKLAIINSLSLFPEETRQKANMDVSYPAGIKARVYVSAAHAEDLLQSWTLW